MQRSRGSLVLAGLSQSASFCTSRGVECLGPLASCFVGDFQRLAFLASKRRTLRCCCPCRNAPFPFIPECCSVHADVRRAGWLVRKAVAKRFPQKTACIRFCRLQTWLRDSTSFPAGAAVQRIFGNIQAQEDFCHVGAAVCRSELHLVVGGRHLEHQATFHFRAQSALATVRPPRGMASEAAAPPRPPLSSSDNRILGKEQHCLCCRAAGSLVAFWPALSRRKGPAQRQILALALGPQRYLAKPRQSAEHKPQRIDAKAAALRSGDTGLRSPLPLCDSIETAYPGRRS
jgi:hypothetical protein